MPRSWRFIVGLGVAASLTPAIALAFGVDPRVERTVADGYLEGSQQPVACNTAGCLAVWSVFSADHMRTVAIRAARIGPTGALLEPSTVTLSEGSTSRYSPSVATDGTNFFVVWVLEGTGVVGARVSGSGALLDAGGVVLAPPATGSQQNPTVAWNGHDYLAAWQEAPAGVSAIRGTRVSAGGVVRDPTGLAIGPLTASTRRMPTVVGVGDGFVVAWEDARVMPYGDLYLARVAADGTVRDPAGVHPFTAFHTRTSPALSSDGSRALLVWQDGDGGPNGVQSALLGADGLAGAVSVLGTTPGRPSAAFDGSHHLVAWARSSVVHHALLSPAGVPVAPGDHTLGAGAFEPPFLASGGAGFQGVVQGGGTPGVLGFRVSADGATTTPPSPITYQANAQTDPRVASDGTDFLVTWSDRRNVLAARVSAAGAVRDAPPLTLASSARQGRVAHDGTAWLVTWVRTDTGGVGAARVPSSGAATTLAAAGTFIPADTLGPGRGYAMIGGIEVSMGAQHGARLQRLPLPSLTPAVAVVVDGRGATLTSPPSVGFDGTNHLAAWQAGGVDPPYCATVDAIRVTPDGDRLDPGPLHLSPCYPTDGLMVPSVAFDGSRYLVVWHARGASGADVFGARVSRGGELLDASPLVLSAAAGDQRNPAVVFDGARFAVVWEDGRAGNRDLYGTRVLPDGSVLDPSGAPIAATLADESSPQLAVNAAGRVLLAYVHADPSLGVDRVEATFAGFEGAADAGVTDAGVTDVGSLSDAAVLDVGFDAGPADAGTLPDAAVADVGLDAGPADAGAPAETSGGLCAVRAGSVGRGGHGVLGLAALAAVLGRRRRRGRR